jgi:hypothetical protein
MIAYNLTEKQQSCQILSRRHQVFHLRAAKDQMKTKQERINRSVDLFHKIASGTVSPSVLKRRGHQILHTKEHGR